MKNKKGANDNKNFDKNSGVRNYNKKVTSYLGKNYYNKITSEMIS
jgi:hypothetical protein